MGAESMSAERLGEFGVLRGSFRGRAVVVVVGCV